MPWSGGRRRRPQRHMASRRRWLLCGPSRQEAALAALAVAAKTRQGITAAARQAAPTLAAQHPPFLAACKAAPSWRRLDWRGSRPALALMLSLPLLSSAAAALAGAAGGGGSLGGCTERSPAAPRCGPARQAGRSAPTSGWVRCQACCHRYCCLCCCYEPAIPSSVPISCAVYATWHRRLLSSTCLALPAVQEGSGAGCGHHPAVH